MKVLSPEQWEEEAHGKSGFEGQWGLTAGIPEDWGKQKLYSWGLTQGLLHTRTQGKKAGTS